MPLIARKTVLAAKVELDIGAAETLSAAEAVINAYDVKMVPDIAFEAREGQQVLSPRTGAVGAYGGTCTFWTDLIGGAGDPLWAGTLLLACAYVKATSYKPKSEAPGANVKTITIGLYQDGRKFALRGAMGTAVFRFPAGRPCRIEFTFRGIWVPPTTADILAPTFPTTAPLRFVSSALLLGASFAPIIDELVFDMGNEVQLRENPADTAGYASAIVAGRNPHGSLSPEASLAKDLYGEWLARAEAGLSLTLGVAGNQVALSIPKLQFTKVSAGERNGLAIEVCEFQCNRSAAAGDDEVAFTIA